MKKTLDQIHNDVHAEHYDRGYRYNFFQMVWHRRRIDVIKKFLPKNVGKVLDAGCHSGFLTSRVIDQQKKVQLHGIDISKSAVALAKKRIKKGTFQVGDIHALPYRSHYFDTIMCFEVLEHVMDPRGVLREFSRVLGRGGNVYVLVPTDGLLFRCIWFVWNILYPQWKHAHIQSFRNNNLEDLLHDCGFRVVKKKKFNLGMLLLLKARKTSREGQWEGVDPEDRSELTAN